MNYLPGVSNLQDKTKLSVSNICANPYKDYSGKFCKVILKGFRQGKPVKGHIDIISENIIRIKGDFLDTSVHIDEILLITTKINNGERDNL